MHDILQALWRQRISCFWPIWITLTVVAAVASAWFVSRARMRVPDEKQEVPSNPVRPQALIWSRNVFAVLVLFGAFLACYIALMMLWEGFAYNDNSVFTLFTLKNHNIDPPIWPYGGRFFPLGFQEFNLVRHFGRSVAAYHALPILQLLIVSLLLVNLDGGLKIAAPVCLAACVLMTPSVFVAFGGLIYQERNVVFWLLCLSFFIKRFDRTQSTSSAVAAIVCAQFMIYYKETAFLFLWGFVGGRLLLRCRNPDRPGWDFSRLQEKASRLDLCFVSLGLVFVLYYAAVMFRHTSLHYAHQQRLPELEVLLAYLRMDLMAWVFVALVIGRTYLIWRRRITPSLLWDGLAYGAMAYFAGFLILGMASAYYLAPVDVIAALCLGRLAIRSFGKLSLGIRIASLLLLFAILFQSVLLSAFREFERKNCIHGNAEIGSVIQAQYQRRAGKTLRLFFPFSSHYVMMEFGAYLSYRGLPVERAGDESAGTNNVVLVSRVVANDGLLEEYHGIRGHAGRGPEPGDLVIVLPKDDASLAESTVYREGGDLLFSYEPGPRVPRAFNFLKRYLHFAFPNRPVIPDRWLDASITRWTISQQPDLRDELQPVPKASAAQH